MGFLSNLFSSFEDQVAKIDDPMELIRLWLNKKNEKKTEDMEVVEARLADVLANVTDLHAFEQLISLVVDERIDDWLRVMDAFISDDDQHILALEERGVFLKHLIALSESPNICRIAMSENAAGEIGAVKPDLKKFFQKGMYDISVEVTQILDVLEARLLEILSEHISGIDDFDVLAGLYDVATIGKGYSEYRILKSRELVISRICVLIDQIDDIAQIKDLSVPGHPEIMETVEARLKDLLSARTRPPSM